ncbi:hypothetical protein HPG69_014142 [Diceros bicornis minor]|uniref:NADP-dependent oxidoreductase domain-containing protein n=1 Tax=Diceros bicornis minor TaxID=77932 RepID=A0A7J7FK06_DICBM|nr:hypothetical protein HPG69_014142 [Diceros bicornis minor]
MRDGTVKREDIFYTTKISGFQTFNVKSRAKLHEKFTSHFPPPESLEKCTDGSLTTSIGVSNFNHTQLEMILNKPEFKYKLISNQVECHPYLNQRNLLEFCKCKDVVVVAYSALGVESDSPYLLEEPILNSIAKKHNQNPGWVTDCYQQLLAEELSFHNQETRSYRSFRKKAEASCRLRSRG